MALGFPSLGGRIIYPSLPSFYVTPPSLARQFSVFMIAPAYTLFCSPRSVGYFFFGVVAPSCVIPLLPPCVVTAHRWSWKRLRMRLIGKRERRGNQDLHGTIGIERRSETRAGFTPLAGGCAENRASPPSLDRYCSIAGERREIRSHLIFNNISFIHCFWFESPARTDSSSSSIYLVNSVPLFIFISGDFRSLTSVVSRPLSFATSTQCPGE